MLDISKLKVFENKTQVRSLSENNKPVIKLDKLYFIFRIYKASAEYMGVYSDDFSFNILFSNSDKKMYIQIVEKSDTSFNVTLCKRKSYRLTKKILSVEICKFFDIKTPKNYFYLEINKVKGEKNIFELVPVV